MGAITWKGRAGLDFADIERECAAIASGYVCRVPVVVVEWNNRFTRRAGDCLVTDHIRGFARLRFSSKLWPLMTPEKRRNTMIHELAHAYAELEQRHSGHGKVWQKWMRRFGLKPERCFDYSAKNFANPEAAVGLLRRQRRYAGPCPGCDEQLTVSSSLRTRWIRSGQTRVCVLCRSELPVAFAKSLGPAT